MHLGNQGTALLPDGGTLPGGPYPVYASLEVDADGVVSGEVHFASEPKYPPPISIGAEFDLHVPHPDSILGDTVNLRVRLVDDSGSVAGYAYGSLAQFRPHHSKELPKAESTPMNAISRQIEMNDPAGPQDDPRAGPPYVFCTSGTARSAGPRYSFALHPNLSGSRMRFTESGVCAL
jgi:hypothetical protein